MWQKSEEMCMTCATKMVLCAVLQWASCNDSASVKHLTMRFAKVATSISKTDHSKAVADRQWQASDFVSAFLSAFLEATEYLARGLNRISERRHAESSYGSEVLVASGLGFSRVLVHWCRTSDRLDGVLNLLGFSWKPGSSQAFEE